MEAAIFDDLSVLGDAVRSRILLLLERHELTVGELCAVVQLPQSTVSRHLKMLADAEWVTSRREGTSRYYSAVDREHPPARRLWTLLREQVAAAPAADQDARRVRTVVARRQTASQHFFESAAGRWDKLREEMFGRAPHLEPVAALLDERWVIGDLGCGTGQLAAALAPFVARVVAVDRSGDMLQAARRRLREWPNVDIRRGDLEALPIEDGSLDAATLVLVLHHVPDPAAVLADAARALRRQGRLLLADMLPHDRDEYRRQMGHVWLGFSEEQVRRLLSGAGFDNVRVVSLPPDPESKGPALFVATGTRT
ncbi:MAG: ArsR/SmtB family transcription factor [Vicinamibacterales bacterium]